MRWMFVVTGLLVGCADDRASLLVPVVVHPSQADLEVYDEGHDEPVLVTLTRASLTLSNLQIEAPAETAARRWSLISAAHAHPGHGGHGAVTGELLGTWTVDLLGDEVLLGEASCLEGDTAAAGFLLPDDPPIQLEGIAEVDGLEQAFAFTVAPDRAVTGLPLVTTLDADAPLASLDMHVDLAHALSYVDWRSVAGEGLLTTDDVELRDTVLSGLSSSSSFRIAPGR